MQLACRHVVATRVSSVCLLQAVVNFPHMGNELWTMPEFVKAALRRIDAHREFHERGPTPTTEAGLRWREVRPPDCVEMAGRRLKGTG